MYIQTTERERERESEREGEREGGKEREGGSGKIKSNWKRKCQIVLLGNLFISRIPFWSNTNIKSADRVLLNILWHGARAARSGNGLAVRHRAAPFEPSTLILGRLWYFSNMLKSREIVSAFLIIKIILLQAVQFICLCTEFMWIQLWIKWCG